LDRRFSGRGRVKCPVTVSVTVSSALLCADQWRFRPPLPTAPAANEQPEQTPASFRVRRSVFDCLFTLRVRFQLGVARRKQTSGLHVQSAINRYSSKTVDCFSFVQPARLLKAGTAGFYVLLLFLIIYLFLTIPRRPIISRSTGPIFAKFSGLVDGRTVSVDDQYDVSFSIPPGTLP